MEKIFYYLATVNILDGAATFWGLHLSAIEESNPMMNSLYEINPIFFILYKLFLSGILYGLILTKRMPTIRFVKILSVAASIIYTFIIGLHGIWILPMLVY